MSWLLSCATYGGVEAWDRIRLGENITFHFDVRLRCLLHIKKEMRNRQMDKQIWSLEEHLGQRYKLGSVAIWRDSSSLVVTQLMNNTYTFCSFVVL